MADRPKIELKEYMTQEEADRSDFRVLAGQTGAQSVVFMDGIMLKGVQMVQTAINIGDAPRIRIDFIANTINEEPEATFSQEELDMMTGMIKVIDNDRDLDQMIRRSIEEGDVDTKIFRELLGKKIKGLT